MTRHLKSDALKLLAWLVCTVVLGATLAPLIFKIGKEVIPGFRMFPEDGSVYRVLTESDFGRYFNRAFLLAAVICFIPLIRSLKIGRGGFGLEKNRRWFVHLIGGFVLAGGLLLAMGFTYMQMGLFERHQEWSWKPFFKFLQQGFGASILEEWLFRGVLLALLMRTMGTFSAALVATLFFALVHFLTPPVGLEVLDKDVGSTTGFWMVGQIFSRFGDINFLVAQFATYFAVGAVLTWSRLRTRSLWLGIGLHAGWVFCLKLYNYYTYVPRRYLPDVVLPYIGEDLKIGLIPLTTVCLTGVLAAIALRIGARRARGDVRPA